MILLSNNTALFNELVSLLLVYFFIFYLFLYKILNIPYLYSFPSKSTQYYAVPGKQINPSRSMHDYFAHCFKEIITNSH